MKLWMVLVVIVLGVLYEKVWRTSKCKKKIQEQIQRKGGTISSIEKISPRNEVYIVKYTLYGERRKETVKFSFFYDEEWY